MSSHHVEDPIHETLAGAARSLLAVASMAGEHMARARADQARQQRVMEEKKARDLAAAISAERELVRSELATYVNTSWIDQAEPGAIGEAWVKARQWQDQDPENFTPFVDKLRDGVQSRFGVDLTDLAAAQDVANAVEGSPLVERETEQPKVDGNQLLDEVIAAGTIAGTGAEVAENAADARRLDDAAAAERDADARLATGERIAAPGDLDGVVDVVNYDSADRRMGLERRAIAAGVEPDIAGGRARAAAAQALPASAATAKKAAAKKSPGKSTARGKDRASERGR